MFQRLMVILLRLFPSSSAAIISAIIITATNEKKNTSEDVHASVNNTGRSTSSAPTKIAQVSELNVALEPTYVIINSEIGYRFLDKKMKVQGQVLNIFNVQYSDILGAKMPGRWVVLSLNFTI